MWPQKIKSLKATARHQVLAHTALRELLSVFSDFLPALARGQEKKFNLRE
jgi:hypothetical protein